MRVIVAAASPVTRAGLKAVVEDAVGCTVTGCVSARELVECAQELNAEVVLWQLLPDEDAAPTLRALAKFSTVLMTSNTALDLIRAGAQGVLPLDASAEQIGIALQAAAAGLGVFPPDHLDTSYEPRAPSILTARETEVLRMIAEGLANKEIAWRLGISDHTVKFHVSAVLGKLGVASRAEAIGAGIRQGLLML
jgi:DNA-binding NarL/FixJ family response regulator